jgi:hypothetical protein
MDLVRDEAIWQEACGDLVGGALDRGGGRSADAVTRSRLIAGSHVKRLHRATIPAPTALSLSSLFSTPRRQYRDVDSFTPADEAL